MIRVTLLDGKVIDLSKGSESILNTEAMLIEKITGWTMQEFLDQLGHQSISAMTAFVFVLAKRAYPEIRYDDIVFSFDALESDEEPAEVAPGPKDDAVATLI